MCSTSGPRAKPLRHAGWFLFFGVGESLTSRRGETPRQFAIRAAGILPALAAEIDFITRLYGDLAYANEDLDEDYKAQLLWQLKGAVREFRLSFR